MCDVIVIFKYLYKKNDFLKEITDRDVEKNIIAHYKDPIYLKIMELSKNIQVSYLEDFTKTIRIGYLYGKGSFSHEAVQNFRGIHIAYPNVEDLKEALREDVDYILLPTYNSIIGEIFSHTSNKYGSIDHKIELNLYCNHNSKKANFLLVEPHIEKEAANYIKSLDIKHIANVSSSIEGMKKLLGYYNDCFTIASAKNESNLYYTIDRDIVKHNITTFTLF